MLTVRITNEEKVKITLHPTTPGGRPAEVDGEPEWEVQAGNVTLEPSEDGMSCDIISADDPGNSEVIVRADADLGEGVVEISDVIHVQVDSAQATSLGLTAGSPEPR